MRTRAGGDDWHAALDRGIKLRKGDIVPFAETQAEHKSVGSIESFGLSEGSAVVRINHAVIVGEEDGALEAVALGENPGEHRQSFFGTIFLVADE